MATPRFTRADGVQLQLVPGFRERVLGMPRTAVRPTLAWGEDEFAAAAAERIRRIERLLRRARKRGVDLRGARLLELGCGPGVDAIIAAALVPRAEVVGIDLDLPLVDGGPGAELPLRLAAAATARLGLGTDVGAALRRLPVRLERASATEMPFEDGSFDFCWSDAVLEHVSPIDTCFAEMSRVLRPGGRAFHRIDPYYWVKGCHRRGLVDLPWAHARLTVDDVVKVARLFHGRSFAARCRARLEELNHLTPGGWRAVVEASGLEVLDWRTASSEFAEQLLRDFPDVEQTLLVELARDDLVTSTVQVWLARP